MKSEGEITFLLTLIFMPLPVSMFLSVVGYNLKIPFLIMMLTYNQSFHSVKNFYIAETFTIHVSFSHFNLGSKQEIPMSSVG